MNSTLTTPEEVCLGLVAEIPPGEGREFHAGGERIAVFRTRGGEVYATQALCPHRDGPLADGLVGGATVICPFHARKFDLSNGRSLSGDCDLKTYPVRLTAEGQILITLR